MFSIPNYYMNDYKNEYQIITKINDKDDIFNVLYNDIKLPKVISNLITSYIGETKYYIIHKRNHITTYGWYLYEIPIKMNHIKGRWEKSGNDKKFIRDTRYYDVIKQEYNEQCEYITMN